jgi:hypothetical protein
MQWVRERRRSCKPGVATKKRPVPVNRRGADTLSLLEMRGLVAVATTACVGCLADAAGTSGYEGVIAKFCSRLTINQGG